MIGSSKNNREDYPRKCSLRSKRFQSSYWAKVRAEAKKKVIHFFCSCPSFLDEPREETLATQARENALEHKNKKPGLNLIPG